MSAPVQPFTGRFERVELPGGIRLHLAPSNKFKTLVVKVFLRTDLTAESATEVALLPYLLRHGTRELPSMRAVNRRLEELYGTQLSLDVLKLGEEQVLSFRLALLGDAFLPAGEGVLEPGLRLLADLLRDPALDGDGFPAVTVRQEQEKLQRFIAGLINDKATYAVESCVRTMCADEPYSLFEYGRLEDLERVTGAQVEARRRLLLSQAPLDVYAVGACDPARLRALLEELFSLPRATPHPGRGTTPHPAPQAVREVRETFQVKQGKLCLGFRCDVRLGDPDYWPFFVMNGVLGGFPHSKLFKNVREKLGLCYDASTSYERYKGLLFLTAGIEPANFARTRDTCLEQLAAIERGELSADELLATRMSYRQAFQGLLDSPPSLVNLDYGMRLAGLDGTPDDANAAVEAVTPDQIQAAASRLHLDTVYFLAPEEGAEGGEEAAE